MLLQTQKVNHLEAFYTFTRKNPFFSNRKCPLVGVHQTGMKMVIEMCSVSDNEIGSNLAGKENRTRIMFGRVIGLRLAT
jgi:hypothetical protein